MLSVVVVGGVVFVLAIDFLGDFVTKPTAKALGGPIGLIVFGVAMIGLAAWGTYRVYRRRSLPEVTRLGIVAWGVTALVLVLIGVIALVSAFGDRADPRAF